MHIRMFAYGLAISTTKRASLSSWDLRGRGREMVLLEFFRRTDALVRGFSRPCLSSLPRAKEVGWLDWVEWSSFTRLDRPSAHRASRLPLQFRLAVFCTSNASRSRHLLTNYRSLWGLVATPLIRRSFVGEPRSLSSCSSRERSTTTF
jgi:hypothetical protein